MPPANPKTNPSCTVSRHGTLQAGRDGCICPETEEKRERKRAISRACELSRTEPTYTEDELARFHGNLIATPDGCVEWNGERNKAGYGIFRVSRSGVPVRRLAHRVAYRLANNVIPPVGLVVRHACDNPPCCASTHLLLGTHADNVQDAVDRGRLRTEHLEAWRGEGFVGHRAARELKAQGKKRCSRCREVKSLEEFYMDNAAKGYRKARCKSCTQQDEAPRWEDLRAQRRSKDPTPTPRGEACRSARLTEQSVRAIRADDRRHKEIAADYDISRSNVSAIKTRQNWGHVQ